MAEYKSSYTGQEIDAGIAKANTAIQEHQDISGKVDKVNGKGLSSNDFTNEEKAKLDNIDMSEKQDTLVSGTNIKTINGNSLLGSGNLAIEGGGGGLSSVAHDETLTGAGTNETPLGVDTTKIATKNDLNGKQDQLVSGTNIKTINNTSILGSGNINIESGGGESVHEVYIGGTEPSETSVLLWVDTSEEPSPGTTNPVTNLAGTTTSNSATLTWTASSNATSYKIYQGDNFIGSTNNVTHTVSNLVASTEYTFGVVATGEGGDSTKVTVTLTTQEGGGGSLPAEYQEVEYVKPVGIANQINTGIEN